jgi:hypothetical protein
LILDIQVKLHDAKKVWFVNSKSIFHYWAPTSVRLRPQGGEPYSHLFVFVEFVEPVEVIVGAATGVPPLQS